MVLLKSQKLLSANTIIRRPPVCSPYEIHRWGAHHDVRAHFSVFLRSAFPLALALCPRRPFSLHHTS